MNDGFSNLCNVLAVAIAGVMALPVLFSFGVLLLWLCALGVQGLQWVLS